MTLREGTVVHRSRDEYGEIVVTDTALNRFLYFDSHYRQSAMSHLHPAILVLRYAQIMAAGVLFRRPSSVLVIGLGGGALIRFLLHYFPACRFDAVELRPRVIEVAHGYFRLPENDPRLRCHVADGRDFLAHAPTDSFAHYDLILLDAFDSEGPSASMHAADVFHAARQRLAPGGLVCANVWNRRCDNFAAQWQGLRRAFDHNAMKFQLERANSNVVLFGVNGPLPALGGEAVHRRAGEVSARVGLDLAGVLRGLRQQNRMRLSRILG